MASVGGVTCDIVSGTKNAQRERVEIWERPGIDGYGAQQVANGDANFRFSLIQFDTLANINTWQSNIEALQATSVTIVDDHGTSHTTCLIRSVVLQSRRACYQGGAAKVRAEIIIEGVVI